MTNMFANATNDLAGAEKEKDVLGGRRKLLPTDAYNAKIDVVYITQSTGGAKAFNFVFKIGDQYHRETVYVTKKTGEVFYVKDGKKHPLPGYSQVNALTKLAIGKEIPALAFEKKILKIYDFEAKKEVPKELEVAVELIGADITIGIEQILENKQVKDQVGAYVATAETREKNEWTRTFHPVSGQTVAEYDAQKPAEFKQLWLNEFKGKVRDFTDKNLKPATPAVGSTATTGGAAPAKTSLFNTPAGG